MAQLLDIVKKGSTNRSVTLRIIDSTTGVPETGVVFDTTGIDLWYRREGAAVVSITEATLAALTTAHTDGGFLTISHGEYRLDAPDAAFATGANHVDFGGTVTGMIVIGGRVRLVDYDPEDTVRLGLTALPNAAADAAGGLPISDAGALDIDTKLAATNEVTAARMAALTDWIDGGRLDLLLDAIPTTAMRGTDNAALASEVTSARMGALTDWINGGRLDLILDIIAADVVNIDGAAMRGTDSAATAAALATTDGKVDTINTATGGLAGAAMRGTDNAATAAALATTDGKLDTADTAIDTLATTVGAAGAGLTDLGGMSTTMKAQVNAEVDTAFTTQIADSVPADGTIATREQALYIITQMLTDFAISGTTLTVKKVDGSTTLMTFTLSDATNPTSLTRAT